MRDRRIMAAAGVMAVVLMAAPGCVSSKLFKANVEDTDSRVAAVENAVESQGKRLDDLRQETDRKVESVAKKAADAQSLGDEAMSLAEKAAKGKLLWTVTISDDRVKFGFGKAELTSDAMAALDDLARRVKEYGKALYLEIEGHTDNIGSEMLNQRLSERRAHAVLQYLNQKGNLPLHAMSTIGFGESRPVADNSSDAGRAQNRRVVVRVLE